MRLGQTSVVHFASRILASVLGFLATVYIARMLGSATLGIYSLTLAIVSWLALFGTMGITSAITKRVSEQEDPAAYALSGTALEVVLFGVLTLLVLAARGPINDYVGFPVAGYVVGMLAVLLGYNVVTSVLNGQHLVHIAGATTPVKTGSRAGIQIAALSAGFGLAWLFAGYIVAHIIVIAVGLIFIVRSFSEVSLPDRHHYKQLLSYAKYSWIGGLRAKAFSWVDIAVLGFFVNPSFIGFYTAAWNIAQFLMVFGASLSSTLFPEMSELSTREDAEAVSDLLDAGLAFAGLLLIPGLIGGAILGNRILRIYGPDFVQAEVVLVILIVATLLQSYQKQLTTTLNAVDRPDLAFRVNSVFVATNLLLNVVLIYLYGWIGAAVATASSVGISLVLANYYVSSIVSFSIPTSDIGKQWFAGGVMGCFVYAGIRFEERYLTLHHNFALVLVLVVIGAAAYFAVLFRISSRFRVTVLDNVPADIR